MKNSLAVINGGLSTDTDDRPLIQLSTDLHVIVPDAIAALAIGPCADANLYQRDGQLVRVVRIAEPETVHVSGRETTLAAAGTPQIRTLPAAVLRERLSAAAIFERFDGRTKQWVATKVPGDVIAAIAERAEWEGVRPIVGISETPILRRDFSIATARGYDAASAVVLEPSGPMPPIPASPTQVHANAALAALLEPFADFPFRAEADRYVPIAAILTVIARHAIAGAVPAIIIDASTRGSGKTLAAHVISTIATGRSAAAMTFPADETELEKVLASYALRAPSLILFDNIAAAFAGAPLDKVLTATDTVELRVLGQSSVPTLRWRALVLATGNQVEVRGDTTRRVLVARLEPDVENPEQRTGFVHSPLLPWVERERTKLVGATLTILRAWHLAGRPLGSCPTWGSFESWAAIVPPAIVFAGGVDPNACRLGHDGDEDRSKEMLRVLLERLPAIDPKGEGLLARDIVSQLYPQRHDKGPPPDDGLDDLREALTFFAPQKGADGVSANRLGYALRKLRGRVVGGLRLEAAEGHGGGMTRWVVREVRR